MNNQNTMTTELPTTKPYHEHPERYIVPVVHAIIFIVGILGNGTLALIFARHRNVRTTTNVYILNLAFGNLLAIACLPFYSVLYAMRSWPFGELVCKSTMFFDDLSSGVTAFTLIALSAECYFALKPRVLRHSSKTLTLLSVLGIWVLALALALPCAFFSHIAIYEHHEIGTVQSCVDYPEEYSKLTPTLQLLVYHSIPLCFIACFYVLILIRQREPEYTMDMQEQSPGSVERKQVSKIVLCFVALFVVCFLPEKTFMLWLLYYPNAGYLCNEYCIAFHIVGFCLSCFHSCVNPIALYCLSDEFRKHFNNYLFHCPSCKLSSSLSTINETLMVDANSTSLTKSITCILPEGDVKAVGESVAMVKCSEGGDVSTTSC